MTQKQTREAIKAIGCTVRFQDGEARVTIAPAEIQRETDCSYAHAVERSEAIAAYCHDEADAIGSARMIRQAWLAELDKIKAPVTGDIKVVGTVQLEPTWRGLLPALIFALQNGTDEGQKIARDELARMALAADRYNGRA